MTDRPILFSGPMVRALLDGRKTQTRRVITKKAAHNALAIFGADFLLLPGNVDLIGYARGDRLWVREKHAICQDCGNYDPCEDANSAGINDRRCCRSCDEMLPKRLRPSIFMPRWASRLTLTVTEVRVQRLQDISEDDAIAEGCRPYFDHDNPSELAGPNGTVHQMAPLRGPLDDFHRLWDSLNADRAPWDSNPWVCAVSFTLHQGNIDQMEAAR